ncbi:MAG: O-antigen ligase family protein, partial [Terriglobales bacterium]
LHRRRHLIAQLTLLAFGIDVLTVSHSSTSGVSFALGAVLLVIAGRKMFTLQPRAIHAVVLAILICGGLAFWLGGEGAVAHDLGRKSNLTGRTEIWAGVLQVAARQPVLGAGFESFWTGQNIRRVWSHLPFGETVNESHDGYIEVYAQLGLVGLAIVAWLLLTAYRRTVAAYAADTETGRLLVAYVATLLVYNITEAGFRMLDPAWLFLLLAFICAAAVIARKGAESDAGRPGGPGLRAQIRTVQALRA